jgi:hypothetical protein
MARQDNPHEAIASKTIAPRHLNLILQICGKPSGFRIRNVLQHPFLALLQIP